MIFCCIEPRLFLIPICYRLVFGHTEYPPLDTVLLPSLKYGDLLHSIE